MGEIDTHNFHMKYRVVPALDIPMLAKLENPHNANVAIVVDLGEIASFSMSFPS